MKVRELIELNQMITDVQITVRINGTRLLDQLNIGCNEGIKPPYPTRVPKDKRYVDNFNVLDHAMYKDAAYIQKSINSWDDDKDYWQVKVNRIPSKWLDLEVFSWEVMPASLYGNPRRSAGHSRNVNFHGERICITALPSGEKLDIEKPETKSEIDGQIEMELIV